MIWAGQSLMFLAGARDFSFPKNVQTGSTDCPVSYSLGAKCLVLRLGMGGATRTSSSLYALMAWIVIVFTSSRNLWSIQNKFFVTTVLRPDIEDTPSILGTFQ
jgi:hypothetical protein